MQIDAVKRKHVQLYLHERDARDRANRAIAFLSTAFEPPITRDRLQRKPCRGVRLNEEMPRTQLVTPEELASLIAFGRARGGTSLKLMIVAELAAIIGKAQGQLVNMTTEQVRADGLHFTEQFRARRKRGRSTIVEWSLKTKRLADELLALDHAPASTHVLVNRDGVGYTLAGFKTGWAKLVQTWVQAGHPTLANSQPDTSMSSRNKRFPLHDLRAYARRQLS
jgi:hypothetical protein